MLAGLSACGSGSGTDSGITRLRINRQSEAIRDGTVRSDGQVETGRHVLSGDRNIAACGDDSLTRETRMFFSFDTSVIPANSRIETATLSFRQFAAINRILFLNPLLIELLDYGDDLDAGDFALAATSTPLNFTLDQLNIVRDVDVTLLVQTAINQGATRTQFRLRMQGGTNGDAVPDLVGFETADNDWGTGDRPVLFVEYDVPNP